MTDQPGTTLETDHGTSSVKVKLTVVHRDTHHSVMLEGDQIGEEILCIARQLIAELDPQIDRGIEKARAFVRYMDEQYHKDLAMLRAQENNDD